MYRSVGLWVVLVACLIVAGYLVYLAVANAPRQIDFALYPWQEGEIAGYWPLIVLLGTGVVLIPCARLLVRTVKRLRAEREKAAEAPTETGGSSPR